MQGGVTFLPQIKMKYNTLSQNKNHVNSVSTCEKKKKNEFVSEKVFSSKVCFNQDSQSIPVGGLLMGAYLKIKVKYIFPKEKYESFLILFVTIKKLEVQLCINFFSDKFHFLPAILQQLLNAQNNPGM